MSGHAADRDVIASALDELARSPDRDVIWAGAQVMGVSEEVALAGLRAMLRKAATIQPKTIIGNML